MLRVAHFSDLHYAGATLTEVDRCFSFAVDAGDRARRGLRRDLGDATDHALEVHAPAVAALARNIRRLADHCPVLMLQGTFSHEPPGALNVFRLLGGRFRVHVADRLQQVALIEDGRWQESPGWRFEQIPPGARADVFLRANGEQGRGGRSGRCHRSGGSGGRATDSAAARVGSHQRGRARRRRADDRRVARHRVRMRDRTRRPDGGVRSRVHHRLALRRGGAGLPARAHPQAPVVGNRTAG